MSDPTTLPARTGTRRSPGRMCWSPAVPLHRRGVLLPLLGTRRTQSLTPSSARWTSERWPRVRSPGA